MAYALPLAGVGLLLLWGGAEVLIHGSAGLALRLGISRVVVGLTVVAFGTSAPELVVSVQSAARGATDLALANVVGSNVCNIALILGLSALLRPLHPDDQVMRFDIPVMIGASLVLGLLVADGHLGFAEGLLLLVGIVAYVGILVREGRHASARVQQEYLEAVPLPQRAVGLDVLQTVGGIALLALGGRLLVDGAIEAARLLEISEAAIGSSAVAFGTSLPELATSVVAALRRHDDIAVGNVVGSNIFNVFAIVGVSALLGPLDPHELGLFDFGAMIAVAILLLPLMATGRGLGRGKGTLLLALYAGYLVAILR